MLIIPPGIKAQEKFKVGDPVPNFDLPYATKDTIVFTTIPHIIPLYRIK